MLADLLNSGREITAEDYQALSMLDETSRGVGMGATEEEIEACPTMIVRADNPGGFCCVC